MKKLSLFLSIVAAAFLMTSCLGESETYYSGAPLSYITVTDEGTRYARTSDGLPMTSSTIQQEMPGSFVFIAYSWKESLNTISAEGIYNVTVTDISDPIEQTTLIPGEAPVLETELPLLAFGNPGYAGAYFDYHLIAAYGYEEGDGNKKELRFYHDFEEESDNKVFIDIRLVNSTTGTVNKDQENVLVAVNFEQLHDYYSEGMSPGTQKTIPLYFRYYREKSDGTIELHETTQPYMMPIAKEE